MKKIIFSLIALTNLVFALEFVELNSNSTIATVKEDANIVASFKISDILHLSSDEQGHYVNLKFAVVRIKEQYNFQVINQAFVNMQQ